MCWIGRLRVLTSCALWALLLYACDTPTAPTERETFSLPQESSDGGILGQYVGAYAWPNERVISENAVDFVVGGARGQSVSVEFCFTGNVTQFHFYSYDLPTWDSISALFYVTIGWAAGGSIYELRLRDTFTCRSRSVTVGYYYHVLVSTVRDHYDRYDGVADLNSASAATVGVHATYPSIGTVDTSLTTLQFDAVADAGGAFIFNVLPL